MEGVVPAARGADPDSRPVSGGGQHASGPRFADGRAVGPDRGGEPACGPRFDAPVAPGGYAWWYLDALSDDGQHGLTLIAFIGSVFSPYYARARRRGLGDPMQHCAVNIALHEGNRKHWTMTERGRTAVTRTASSLTIGPSSLAWDGAALTVELDEMTAPWPARVRGTVRLHAHALTRHVARLDGVGLHRWQPIAPCAQVEVALTQPDLRWSGPGYFDCNAGDTPLEDTFAHWHWSRACTRDGTAILYDVCRRDDVRTSLALRCDSAGGIQEFAPPRAVRLPMTRWRVDRATRADDGSVATVTRTLEDTPFYARSLVTSRLLGQSALALHESLSLERFRANWVRMLLPFRMPRRQ